MKDCMAALHKSTLDGSNNTVTNKLTARDAAKKLHISDQELQQKRRLLGLTNEEELDALGVVKRRAGNLEQFTPFSRIVAHGWLNSLSDEQRAGLKLRISRFGTQGMLRKLKAMMAYMLTFPLMVNTSLSRLAQADIDHDLKDKLQNSSQPLNPPQYLTAFCLKLMATVWGSTF